jgi:2-desacetyl-2-hydroxyethyl bacteriochlorophyllide A dehydrogenase
MSTRQALYFARPYQVEVRTEVLPPLSAGQVAVKSEMSAISGGTELLFYRGQVPAEMSIDATIGGMAQTVAYPLPYGYCTVGHVEAIGDHVDASWLNRRVFAFHPHCSAFICDPTTLLPIPDHLTYEQALFLPNMETAVNFVMDARPLLGERVLVFGLGVVGLLTLFVLRKFPLEALCVVDGYANRRQIAHNWGADALYSPEELSSRHVLDPDLILEVSSNPSALATAINVSGFGTRIVVGSWYGDKTAHLPLGGMYHRNRVQIVSSQVSTVDGQFANRWTKSRRLQTAWKLLEDLPIGDLITHRFSLVAAAKAYHLLDQHPDQALQMVFTY